MIKKRIGLIIGILVISSLLISACQPVVQTVEVISTQVVERPVEVIQTQQVVRTEVVEVLQGAYTRPHPILSDERVRKALAYCTNKLDLTASVYPLLSEEERLPLVMHTFIPNDHWAYAGDENVAIYPYDPEQGRALLEEAGWTYADEESEFRSNSDGEDLALKFTTTDAAFRQTWAAVWEQQMADCGIQIVRLHAPASWFFGDTTGVNRRDFELGAYAWVGQADPAGQTIYACDQIPLPENGWVGQNRNGWCNERASDAIKAANNSLEREARIENYRIAQEEFTKDMISIPLFNRTNTYAVTAGLQGFSPSPGQPFVTYNVQEWEIPGQDTIAFGFTQEPASLFALVESAQVAVLAASLVYGFAYTSLNYDYQPVMLNELPTLESGLSTNSEVEVQEGELVWDSTGNRVELATGVKVINAAGEEVEFSGEPVTMMQIVSTFEFRDDLVWSDGTPVSRADYELKWKIDCDRESGATSFIVCDQVQGLEFADNGYTVTLLPGVQSPLYFLNLDNASFPDIYPAHRVIESEGPYQGMTLAEVPAKDWTTLPEIAESPIGVGPYVITEWVKGERMVFEANPYYYGGPPKTPNFIISFVTPENAEAQLIGGQVDILDDTTLVGVTEVLQAAEDAGQIQTLVIPSATWEHIDMQLFLP